MPGALAVPYLVFVECLNLHWPSGVSQHKAKGKTKALLDWPVRWPELRTPRRAYWPHHCYWLPCSWSISQQSVSTMELIHHPGGDSTLVLHCHWSPWAHLLPLQVLQWELGVLVTTLLPPPSPGWPSRSCFPGHQCLFRQLKPCYPEVTLENDDHYKCGYKYSINSEYKGIVKFESGQWTILG